MVTATNERLSQSDRHFATLAQKAPMGIFGTDLSGNCLYVNERRCEISGLSLKQSSGQGWRVAVHPEDLPLVEAQAQKILPHEKSSTTEFRLQNPQGKITLVLSESVVKEDLADQLPKENQHQWQLLWGRVRRMESLINDLFEYYRIGRIHTELSMVNIDSLLQEVVDSLQPPPTFHIEIQLGMPTFVTKKVPLQQVFANLISNAIDHHTRADDHVKISVRDLGKYYEFTVSDDRTGIPVEYHNKIFGVFPTLESRTMLRPAVAHRQENTGMGRAIVKKIMEIEGGAITIKPVSGTGSTFRFTWMKQSLE